jgi:isoleucyl-tRNA synthetase
MDYRDTLNLPRTRFPMRANLPEREPAIQEQWRKEGIYWKLMEKNAHGDSFILHDGPPYANGDIHLGTALNKILKDIIIRYKSMRGFRCPYVPGWDCHGQPIEHEVEKRLGREKDELQPMDIRRRCREYALQYVARQSEQFQRLGVQGDFEHPYLTLEPAYEAVNIRVLSRLLEKGLLYRSRKPIHWCPRCVTALAEAELEYKNKVSPSIYVRFPLRKEIGQGGGGKEIDLVIWTTTPWTLPANVAVAVHPEMNYILVDTGGHRLIIGEPMLDRALDEMGVEKYETAGKIKGKELEGLEALHPWRDRPSRVVSSRFVTMEQGTGLVHIAPGHGEEDYQVGLEYDLPMPMPVDDHGRFTEEAPEFQGKFIEDANDEIVEDLKRRGRLIAVGEIEHPYPHCWRCKGPVIFRATPQWFISVDREYEGSTLRRRCLESLKDVEWIPQWNRRRMEGMLQLRPDWCISRQRAWGVPIPAFYCRDCGEILLNQRTLREVEKLIAEEGSDAWFLKEAGEILGEEARCEACGSGNLRKETDILDVWFESGVSHEAVLTAWEGLEWPCDMYLEGSDQHRGWFQTSLLTAVGSRGRPPYRSVLTHGFVVDGEGRKMSKSLGNVINPMDICSSLGADILRLWVASADYTVDIPASGEIFDRLVEAYRRIRNTLRFLLGNLHDFDPSRDLLSYEDMEELDQWILSRFQGLVRRCLQAYDRYQLHIVYHAVHNFCTVDLSSLYLDMRKDCLYTFHPRSRERRSSQTAVYLLLRGLTRLLAPVLCHTMEEAWRNIPGMEKESVHLQDMPDVEEDLCRPDLEEIFDVLLRIREKVTKSIEEKRARGEMGTSLEAKVALRLSPSLRKTVESRVELLPTFFIVSEVTVSFDNVDEEVEVEVERAEGKKCSRCWNYRTSVGRDPDHPEICDRCLTVLRELAS